MKIVLAFSLAVLCAAVLQPTEAAKTTNQPTNEVSFWKSPIDYAKGKVQKVTQYVTGLANKVWKKVEDGIVFLKKSAAELWPSVEKKIKDRVTQLSSDVKKLKKSTKNFSEQLIAKAHEKLLKLALYIVSANKTGVDIAKTIETDMREIRDLETTLLATIQSGPDTNPCVTDGKNQALELKNENLGKYAACKSHAYEAIKEVGEFLFNSAVVLGPKCVAAAVSLTKAQAVPLYYVQFALLVGKIVFNDLPKVFKEGKKQYAAIREAVQQGSQCIIDKFNESKLKWNKLSEKLAKC